MQQFIQYTALDQNSYEQLAGFAVGLASDVQLYPTHNVINIEMSSADEVGLFIDKNGLNFQIYPIEVDEDNLRKITQSGIADPISLHRVIDILTAKIEETTRKNEETIAELKKSSEEAKKDLLNYQKWYGESINQRDRIRKQVEAIAVLMNSILTPEY